MQGKRKCKPFDPGLTQYAWNENQANIYATYGRVGSNINEVARVLGMDTGAISKTIRSIEKRAAQNGWTPESNLARHVPEGYHVKGKSILLDGDGEIKQQWLKTDMDRERQQEAFKTFIEELSREVKPAKPQKLTGKKRDPSLMNGIFVGDGHFGMYAFAPETKHSDFDTDTASEFVRKAIDNLVSRATEAKTGLLVNVGDLIHTNTSHNTTFKGTPVDTDTRLHRVMKVAADTLRYGIDSMLQKHDKIIVVNARGNHDPDTAIGIQIALTMRYENEPRVTILETNTWMHYIEWGKWLIGINHGDKIKPARLVNVMARDMAEAWGRTTHRMWAVGHIHHEKVIEIDGCTVQAFATLAPRDSWHTSAGYGSDQQMQMITFKKEGGKHSTLTYEIPRPVVEADARIK